MTSHKHVEKTFEVKSPTRVDLAGGTLDLWPLYTFFSPSYTINLAINIYTSAQLTVISEKTVEIEMRDLKFKKNFIDVKSFLSDEEPLLRLLQTLVKYFAPDFGFRLSTHSESPVGGGLGGSSSLVVSLIKVFAKATGKSILSHDLVYLAHNLEAQMLKVPTGTQDYYPAVIGGLNILKYGLEKTEWRTLHDNIGDFYKNFILVYTGRPHQSGLNNWKVLKDAIENTSHDHKTTTQSLKDLQAVSVSMVEVLEAKQFGKLAPLLQMEYEARVRLSKVFSSPEIERLKEISLKAGASAIKICGAGGGGCVLIWSEAHRRQEVLQACREAKFQVMENIQVVERAPEVEIY